MRTGRMSGGGSWLLPICVFALYAASPLKIQTDSIWSIPTAASILHEHNTDLDEFAGEMARRHQYAILEVHGHHYNYFPLGASLAALPFLCVTDGLVSAAARWGHGPSWLQRALERWQQHFDVPAAMDAGWFNVTELLIASAWVSVATWLVFLTARRSLGGRAALVLALLFAFGTSAYSTASRVLWQHGPSMTMVAAVVFLLSAPRRERWQSFALGVVVALAYVFRPTNSLTILAVTAFLVLRHRDELGAYFLGAGCIAIPFCAFNRSLYGTLLPPYYLGSRLTGAHFLEALAGNLVSAGRGLLVFSPIVLFALASALQRLRRKELRDFEAAFLGVVAAHWVAVSAFPHWWAGHSFGPRFFTDVLPYLVYFLAPWSQRLASPREAFRGAGLAFGFAALLSVAIHLRGATAKATWSWNDTPRNVDADPSRLWDYSDLQFLRRG